MKCPACKYENRYEAIWVDDIIRYKSGKRKGEIKETKKKLIEFHKSDPNFITVKTRQNDEFYYHEEWDDVSCVLKACPKCGTIFVDELNKEWSWIH